MLYSHIYVVNWLKRNGWIRYITHWFLTFCFKIFLSSINNVYKAILLKYFRIVLEIYGNTIYLCLVHMKISMHLTWYLISSGTSCSRHFTEIRSTFNSPNYPSSYPVGVACRYAFYLQPGYCNVEITFIDFFLEPAGAGLPCSRDYFEISGVRYCGQQLRGVTSKWMC